MLPDTDEKLLRDALSRYQPEAPDWLATRIVANATAQPQNVGVFTFLSRAFSEWNYGLQFKGAVLAAFAMLGLLGAQLSANNATTHGLDVRNVLMADPNWTEEL